MKPVKQVEVKPVVTKCRGELKPMPTYEVTLSLPSGEVLALGKGYTRKYAAILPKYAHRIPQPRSASGRGVGREV
jgi:hypothetical protein